MTTSRYSVRFILFVLIFANLHELVNVRRPFPRRRRTYINVGSIPKPEGLRHHAIIASGLVFVSGQHGLDPDNKEEKGELDEYEDEDGAKQDEDCKNPHKPKSKREESETEPPKPPETSPKPPATSPKPPETPPPTENAPDDADDDASDEEDDDEDTDPFTKQAETALSRVIKIVEAAGGHRENIVRVISYLTTMEDLEDLRDVFAANFKRVPAQVEVEVSYLGDHIEIIMEAMAVLDHDSYHDTQPHFWGPA